MKKNSEFWYIFHIPPPPWRSPNKITIDVADARDNLMVSKITQVYSSNTHGAEGVKYKVGDLVMLSTINRRKLGGRTTRTPMKIGLLN